MFEALKNKMMISESKKLSEDALNILCEEYEYDDELEDLVDADEVSSDDDKLERLINDLPEDLDLESDNGLMAENEAIDKFLGEPAPAEVAEVDLDLEGASANDIEKTATDAAPSELADTDIDISEDFDLI